ncbi:MAG: DUF2807 domain-containing protein [Candidatus Lernaella stagnicola]|nr:DUF2807 domain-containing protein [Candidatus Lernaella stagnicola]
MRRAAWYGWVIACVLLATSCFAGVAAASCESDADCPGGICLDGMCQSAGPGITLQSSFGYSFHVTSLPAAGNTAEAILAEIGRTAGLTNMPEIHPANVPSALAAFHNGRRIILYNPDFLAQLNQAAGTNWCVYYVFAHELGHHLEGHTVEMQRQDAWRCEYQADAFAARTLKRMGARLDEIVNCVRATPAPPSPTHPSSSDREQNMRAAYNNAPGGPSPTPVRRPVAQPVATPVYQPTPPPVTVPTPPQGDMQGQVVIVQRQQQSMSRPEPADGDAGHSGAADVAVCGGSFTKVLIRGTMNVTIVEGKAPGCSVESGDASLIEFTRSGDTLVIDEKSGSGTAARVSVTTSRLRSVTNSGTGYTHVRKTGGAITFVLKGTGNVVASGSASELSVSASGTGGFDGGNLEAADARVDVSGISNTTVFVTGTLNVAISGMGRVGYRGNPSNVIQKISGMGSVEKLD